MLIKFFSFVIKFNIHEILNCLKNNFYNNDQLNELANFSDKLIINRFLKSKHKKS